MIWRAIILALVVALIVPSPVVLATTAPPDSTPTIEDIYIYRHLLQNNDFLVVAKYNIPYGATPNASVAQAFLFRLIDTDNTTPLLANEAYSFKSSGYGYGLISFYTDNASAPTWGQNYYIQIAGKPSEFADPSIVTWNTIVPTSAYSTLVGSESNQSDLALKIVSIAEDLESAWTATLLESGDSGIVLSDVGAIYFKQSILGIQRMAPDLFLVQIDDPTYEAQDWTNAQATTYRTRFSGTWVGDAIQGVGDLFGMEFHYIASIPLILAMIFCIVMGGQQGNVLSGLMDTVAIAIFGGLMGWTPMLMVAIGTIGIAAYMGYQWFLKSSS